MKQLDFTGLVEERILKIQMLLVTKGAEYATGDDRFHNFKRAADLERTTAEACLVGMLTKHLVSVLDIVDTLSKTGELPGAHVIDEKIGDCINYFILLEGLLTERLQARREIQQIRRSMVCKQLVQNDTSAALDRLQETIDALETVEEQPPEVPRKPVIQIEGDVGEAARQLQPAVKVLAKLLDVPAENCYYGPQRELDRGIYVSDGDSQYNLIKILVKLTHNMLKTQAMLKTQERVHSGEQD